MKRRFHARDAPRTLLWAAGAIALFALRYALISPNYAAQAQQVPAVTITPTITATHTLNAHGRLRRRLLRLLIACVQPTMPN